jgi:NADH-quinone oxidoreductase subunit N
MIAAAISRPPVDWFALSPSLVLLGVAGLCLMVAVFLPPPWRKPAAAIVTAGGFVGAFVAAALLYDRSADGESVIAAAIQRDRLGAYAALLVCFAGLLAVFVAYKRETVTDTVTVTGTVPERAAPAKDPHIAEYFALLAAAGAGMVFLVTANTLLTLFLGLEWFSLCLYVLCAIDVGLVGSLEAGLKYLIVGGFGSALLLFGSALVYGATGELGFADIAAAVQAQGLSNDALLVAGLAMILAGLGFKASAAPFHMWTPDVYQGAPTPVTSFMSAATKTAALVLALRVLVTAFPQEAEIWTIALAVIVCCSLAIGNLAALVQRDVKRILAYSSISHAGFMLIGLASNNALGYRALLFYLIPYGAAALGAFAVVAARERELNRAVEVDDLAGMGWERPILGVAMWLFMLSSAGFPLTGGFLAKFYVFSAAYQRGWVWLIVVGAVATAVSLYYYLGIVRALYMRPGAELGLAPIGGEPPREAWLGAAVVACGVITVGSFFAAGGLVDLARDAVSGSLLL